MKANLTELIFILDKSGSMSGLESDTIGGYNAMLKKQQEEQRASKVMFVITTDGMENASFEYTYEKIKCMVERQKKKHGWEFIFLGANIDAISTAAKFGISSDRAANYNADEKGTRLNYEAVSNAISGLRSNKRVDENWKSEIDEDFTKRGKKGRM